MAETALPTPPPEDGDAADAAPEADGAAALPPVDTDTPPDVPGPPPADAPALAVEATAAAASEERRVVRGSKVMALPPHQETVRYHLLNHS